MAIAFPVELVIDDDAIGWADYAVAIGQEVACECFGVGIDEPGAGIESLAVLGAVRSVGLEVIELAGADARDEDTPDISPAVGAGVKADDFGRLHVAHFVV